MMRLDSEISRSRGNSCLREDENWLLFKANLAPFMVRISVV